MNAFSRLTRPLAIACAVAAACCFSACKTGGNGLNTSDQERLDDFVKEAKQQYEEGAYDKTRELAVKAQDLDPHDLEAILLQGWSLLQLGRYDDFINPLSKTNLDGARTVFRKLLKLSPREFKAEQGLASIDFREYFEFRRKAEIFHRFEKQFADLRTGLPRLRADSGTFEEVSSRKSAFLRDWRAASDKYRELQTSEVKIFESADDPGVRLTGRAWTMEELALDEIDYYVRRYDFDGLAPKFALFEKSFGDAGGFWERKGLARLQLAVDAFEDLGRRAPEYYHIKHDLALVHLALGDYFLQKALVEAERDFFRQQPNAKVPASDLPEVIADFFADKKLHQSPRRQIIEEQFARAAKCIEEYVIADEAFEVRADRQERHHGRCARHLSGRRKGHRQGEARAQEEPDRLPPDDLHLPEVWEPAPRQGQELDRRHGLGGCEGPGPELHPRRDLREAGRVRNRA
jgi:hypothetical protein